MEMNRRTFLKGAAVTAAAVAMNGLLAGCSSTNDDLYVEVSGLGQTADLQGIQMKVESLGTIYDGSTGVFYMVPTIRVTNNGVLTIAVSPRGGSFSIVLPNKTELTLDNDTMNRISQSSNLSPLQDQWLPRSSSVRGDICASGSGVSRVDYVYVVYYPQASDRTTYLRCKIYSTEFYQMLGF